MSKHFFSTVAFGLSTAIVLSLATLPLCAGEVVVFAAASLTESIRAIAAEYKKESADKIVVNLGASSTLARQIEEGAPADIFFSADEAKMDQLDQKGLLIRDTRRIRLSNSLVIVVAAEGSVHIDGPKDLATDKVKRLALAEPKTVPAGIYAKEYLQRQRLWSGTESKVIPTENVRGALAAVEAGNVEAAIVYKTDAAISKKVRIAYQIPAEDSPAIRYPMAVLREAKHPESARKFLQYLDSEAAAKIFERFGFIVRKSGAPA